jgi:hypothetical protein
MQVLTFFEVSGRMRPEVRMKPKMTPAVKAYFRAVTSLGGKARASRYSHGQLSAWARKGGRPARLDKASLARLRKLRTAGKTIAECAGILGVSCSTVARARRMTA